MEVKEGEGFNDVSKKPVKPGKIDVVGVGISVQNDKRLAFTNGIRVSSIDVLSTELIEGMSIKAQRNKVEKADNQER